MTKIKMKLIKCAKCGKESEQALVYSVNGMLGSKKANKDLMKMKQQCPHCKYEAKDISK